MPGSPTNISTALTAPSAPSTPIVGVKAAVTIQPLGSNSWILLKNSKYTIKPKNEIKTASNTVDGILRCPSLNDYEFTINGFNDATSSTTYVEGEILPGTIINFRLYRSYTSTTSGGEITAVNGDCWQGVGILSDASFETGVDEDPESWELGGMKQSGTLTLPNGTTF